MKHFSLFLLAVLLLLSGGCAGTLYPLTDRDLLPEQVNLTPGSYRVVREVSGRTHALYILGIGGMKAKPRESYDQMVARAALAPNQTIINVKTEQRIRGWLGSGRWSLVAQHDIITYGTVIEFVDTPPLLATPQVPVASQQLGDSLSDAGEDSQDEIGDVFTWRGVKVKIVENLGEGYYRITPAAHIKRMSWIEANDYCAALGNGWRLPTYEEYLVLAKGKSTRFWTSEVDSDNGTVFFYDPNNAFNEYKNYTTDKSRKFKIIPIADVYLH